MNLYHYFEKGNEPCRTLSDLSEEQARAVQDSLKTNDNIYARRDYDGNYMRFRRIVEHNVREAFIQKGGKPIRKTPIYFILSENHLQSRTSYSEWFVNPDYIEIPIDGIDPHSVSFTYGDSFIENHPEHRDQSEYYERVLTLAEIMEQIKTRGLPQDSLTEDAPFWVPRYIEAQVWCDI